MRLKIEILMFSSNTLMDYFAGFLRCVNCTLETIALENVTSTYRENLQRDSFWHSKRTVAIPVLNVLDSGIIIH